MICWSGKVRAYAVVGTNRYPGLPDVPTMAEVMGKQSFKACSRLGLVAPAGTPKAVTMQLEKALALALLKKGFEVEICEQAQVSGEVGAGVQMSANGTRLFYEMGGTNFSTWPPNPRARRFARGAQVRRGSCWTWAPSPSSVMVILT
jgi:hypothetical protein